MLPAADAFGALPISCSFSLSFSRTGRCRFRAPSHQRPLEMALEVTPPEASSSIARLPLTRGVECHCGERSSATLVSFPVPLARMFT